MKKIFKHWPLGLLIIFLIVLIYFIIDVNGYEDDSDVKLLKAMNEKIDVSIALKEKRQDKMKLELESKSKKINELQSHLDTTTKEINHLKERLKKLAQKTKPFKDLQKCQTEYNRLYNDYDICLSLSKQQEEALLLFSKQKEELENRFNLQKMSYVECREEVALLNTKITGCERVINRLEKRIKKAKLMSIAKGVVGGALLTLVLKALL